MSLEDTNATETVASASRIFKLELKLFEKKTVEDAKECDLDLQEGRELQRILRMNGLIAL